MDVEFLLVLSLRGDIWTVGAVEAAAKILTLILRLEIQGVDMLTATLENQ